MSHGDGLGSRRFTRYRLFTTPVRVEFGKVGSFALAIGEGTVTVMGKAGPVDLPNVLHVPELVGNLFSTKVSVTGGSASLFLPSAHPDGEHRVAIVRNARVIESKGSITVQGTVALTASLSGGLYLLDLQRGAHPGPPSCTIEKIPQSYAALVRSSVPPPAVQRQIAAAPPLSLPDSVVQEAWLWHRRLGHTGFATLAELRRKNMLPDCQVTPQQFLQVRDVDVCEPCVVGKLQRVSHPLRQPRSVRVLHRVHMDLCSFQDKHFLTFVDEATRYGTVILLSRKSEAAEHIKQLIVWSETQTDAHVQRVRHDRGGEFMSEALQGWYRDRGIQMEPTAGYSPESNGIAERYNRTILAIALPMHADSADPKRALPVLPAAWIGAALLYAADLCNARPASGAHLGRTPHEGFLGRPVSLSVFRRFGCRVWVHTPSALRDKLAPRAVPGRFIGFVRPLASGIYRILLDTGKETQSQTVVFADHQAPPPLVLPTEPAADTPSVLPPWWPSSEQSVPPPSLDVVPSDDDNCDDDDDDVSPAVAPVAPVTESDSSAADPDMADSASEDPLADSDNVSDDGSVGEFAAPLSPAVSDSASEVSLHQPCAPVPAAPLAPAPAAAVQPESHWQTTRGGARRSSRAKAPNYRACVATTAAAGDEQTAARSSQRAAPQPARAGKRRGRRGKGATRRYRARKRKTAKRSCGRLLQVVSGCETTGFAPPLESESAPTYPACGAGHLTPRDTATAAAADKPIAVSQPAEGEIVLGPFRPDQVRPQDCVSALVSMTEISAGCSKPPPPAAVLPDHRDPDPLSVHDALSRHDANEWRQAIDSELASFDEHDVWYPCELPPGKTALPSQMLLERKRDGRYKARLVAGGHKQLHGVDFEETYAPVCSYRTMRMILSIVAHENLAWRQFDIRTAFLHGELKEEVYLRPPRGLEGVAGGSKVLRLKKALYGLRQASRAWNKRLEGELLDRGFVQSNADPALWILYGAGGAVLSMFYVDDGLVAAKADEEADALVDLIESMFAIRRIVDPQDFLGIEFSRDRGAGTITIDQSRKIVAMALAAGVAGEKRSTPMTPAAFASLRKARPADKRADRWLYQSLLGKCLHLAQCTRPDIALVVGALAAFGSDPTQEHFDALLDLIRYLSSTAERRDHLRRL